VIGTGGLSTARLGRMHDVMAGYVERGEVPGLVTLVSRRGEVHVDALGLKAAGGRDPVQRDTIFRISSMTKPITAAAAMILVEECKLRLDEPVDRLLPELADRQVLQRLDGPLDDTVPAHRPISVRDLLTFRMGFGMVMAPSGTYPIQDASIEQLLGQGPPSPQIPPEPDEWIRRLRTLPLMHQPGERWMYVAGSVGTFGWDGGLGTSWYSDPAEDMVAILMTQASWTSPSPPDICLDFWTSAYQAIDD
jgi:CubicO group peptidase (beta-lactamase class C family)